MKRENPGEAPREAKRASGSDRREPLKPASKVTMPLPGFGGERDKPCKQCGEITHATWYCEKCSRQAQERTDIRRRELDQAQGAVNRLLVRVAATDKLESRKAAKELAGTWEQAIEIANAMPDVLTLDLEAMPDLGPDCENLEAAVKLARTKQIVALRDMGRLFASHNLLIVSNGAAYWDILEHMRQQRGAQ